MRVDLSEYINFCIRDLRYKMAYHFQKGSPYAGHGCDRKFDRLQSLPAWWNQSMATRINFKRTHTFVFVAPKGMRITPPTSLNSA